MRLIWLIQYLFIYINPSFTRLTGLTLQELNQTSIPAFLSNTAFAPTTSGNTHNILPLNKPDGTLLKLRVSESPINLSDGSKGRCYTLTQVSESTNGDKKFYELADASPAMILLQDKDGRAYYFNKAWLEFTGKPVKEQLNTHWETLIYWDDRKALKDIRQNMADRKSFATEYRLLKYDGTYRSLFVVGTPVIAEEGIFEGYMSSCLDITEVREAQNTIAQLTHELKQANEELEQFTYVTSHDLQEPLRMITAYVQLIQKNIDKGNLASIKEFMEFVLSGTARMHTLIADILHLSRVNRKGAPFAPVEIKEVLTVTTAHLAKKIKATQAKIHYGDMPIVTGDTFQLVSLFENLLDNALKFITVNTVPDITIKVDENDEKYIFGIKDNGIGIDIKFHKRIFAIFQRLHTRGEYEGTGIGLAVCKKIVERHGGEIWVESEPGVGSTFYFSIKI